MKQKPPGLARQYVVALRKHLKQGGRASLQPALRLGRQAVTLGFETLDLARIHEDALLRLKPSSRTRGLIKRAEAFFAETIAPIGEANRAARPARFGSIGMDETLGGRTAKLVVANRQLERGILRHKGAATAHRKNGKYFSRQLMDSLQLQKNLRRQAHHELAAQEEERLKMSRELQDEVAQTLLGINVRLLALKTESRSNPGKLTKDIASAQRLVEQCAQSINRFARELNPARLRGQH